MTEKYNIYKTTEGKPELYMKSVDAEYVASVCRALKRIHPDRDFLPAKIFSDELGNYSLSEVISNDQSMKKHPYFCNCFFHRLGRREVSSRALFITLAVFYGLIIALVGFWE